MSTAPVTGTPGAEADDHNLPDLATISDRRVAGTAVADLAARVATLGLGMVTVALLTRHLGVEGFASFNYALAWGLLFAPLIDFGLSQAAINRLSVRDVSPSQIAGSLLAMRLAMSLLFGGLAAVLAVATAPNRTVAIGSLVVCLGMVLSTPASLIAVVRTAMKPIWIIIGNASNAIIWAAMAVVLIVADAGVVPFVIASTAAGLASSLIALLMARRLTPIARPTREALMALLRLSLPLGIAAIAMAVYYRINSILLYQISGADEAGHLAAAQRLLDQVQIIPIAIIGAVFPLISEAAVNNPARLRRFVIAAWEILLGFGLPIVALGMAVAHPLSRLLFGAEFEGPTGTVLMIVWPVVIAIFIGYLGGALVPALNLVRIWMAVAFAGAILNVALNLALIPPFQARGAAVATLGTEFPIMVVMLWIALRRADLRLPVGRVARMALAAAAAGGAAAVVAPHSLIGALAAGAALYLALLPLLRIVDLRALLDAVRNPKAAVDALG
ncbi:MAG: flippase [Thermoleophilia bacterium]